MGPSLGSILVVLSTVVSFAACGDDSSDASASSTSGAGAAASSSAAAGGGGTGGASPSGCPPTPPTPKAACAAMITCTYGDDLRGPCRQHFACDGAQWSAPVSAGGGTCVSADQCPPSTPAPLAECTQADEGDLCAYQDGTQCLCSSCTPGGGAFCMPVDPPQWFCSAPSGDPGCPLIIPNEGVACGDEILHCHYPGGCGVSVTCSGGAWTWSNDTCPGRG